MKKLILLLIVVMVLLCSSAWGDKVDDNINSGFNKARQDIFVNYYFYHYSDTDDTIVYVRPCGDISMDFVRLVYNEDNEIVRIITNGYTGASNCLHEWMRTWLTKKDVEVLYQNNLISKEDYLKGGRIMKYKEQTH